MALLTTNNSIFALVATTKYLLLVELNSKNVVPLENQRPEYYGISWFPGAEDLILSHSALDNSSLVDIAGYVQSEAGYLSCGAAVTAGFLSAPHQILCVSDGRVICTNTGRNALAVIDLAKPDTVQEVRISSARWDRLSRDDVQGDHLNSVFEKEGFLYAIAHGHNKGSELITLRYPELQVVAREPIKDRTGLHNIWVTDEDQKISCHSESGALLELNSGAILWEAGSPIYTRGLAATAEFVLVGESQQTGRDLRSASISALWLIDRNTWRTLDYICLGPYGAVQEVRLLNVADHAHHGHPYSGVAILSTRDLRRAITTEKLQTSALAYRNREAWQDYMLITGTPVAGAHGARTASAGCICLLAQSAAAGGINGALTFRYALNDPPGESHVAAVCYRGLGGDTDMHALLIQRVSQTQARLSLWINDGLSWQVQPEIGIDGLPIEAEVRFRVAPHIELYLNNQLTVELPMEVMRASEGSLGIRWLGATIYPLADMANHA